MIRGMLQFFLLTLSLFDIAVSSGLDGVYDPQQAFKLMAHEPKVPSLFVSKNIVLNGSLDKLSEIALKAYRLIKEPQLSGYDFVKSYIPHNLNPTPDDEHLVLHLNVPVDDGGECAALFYHHKKDLVIRYSDAENWAQVVIRKAQVVEQDNLLASIANVLSQRNSKEMLLLLQQDPYIYDDLLCIAGTDIQPTRKVEPVASLQHMSGIKMTLDTGKSLVLYVHDNQLKQFDLLDRISNDWTLPETFDPYDVECSHPTTHGAVPVHRCSGRSMMEFERTASIAYKMLRQRDSIIQFRWDEELNVQKVVVVIVDKLFRYFVHFYYINNRLYFSCIDDNRWMCLEGKIARNYMWSH